MTTTGVFYNEGQNLLAELAANHQVNLFFHLFVAPSTVNVSDLPEGLYTELQNSGYAPQRITSAQLHIASTPPPLHWAVQGFVFNLGPPISGYSIIRGWWIDYEGPSTNAGSLYGGLFDSPITIPPAGFTLTIAKIDLFLHDCGIVPPPLPNAVWFDPFLDNDGVLVPPHPPLIGAAWTPGLGVFAIADARLIRTAGTPSDSITFDPGVSDGTITFSPLCASSGGANFQRPALLFRVQDPDNHWQAIYAPDVGLAVVQRVLGGVTTTPINLTIPTQSLSAAVLEVVLAGPSISLRVDETISGSTVDPTFQINTLMGVLCQTIGSGSGASWRNLLVRH